MKKAFTLLLVACFSATLFAQTIVSTTPSNKNVILEEYTGTNCPYCPDGHKTGNLIMTNNPDRAWAINIHQGGFSGNNPDYKTEWGNALANQYGISSYPAATVNRGTSWTSSRPTWITWANAILAESSPVNVAATATIDWKTRLLTVYVEVYYTGDAANPTNKLNVALLQDNILGPQQGGSAYYPAMMRFGTYYQHMHMFRHFLTGQWGEDIPTTTTGTFYSQTFTYTIPAHIRNVPIFLEDLEVLAFVNEGNKTILSACKAEMAYENKPNCIGRIELIDEKFVPACDGSNGAICFVRNSNDFEVNSVNISYAVAGGAPDQYIWNNRTIPAQSLDTIHLPSLLIAPNIDQNLVVTVTKMNNIICNFSQSKMLKKEVAIGDASMTLVITTDRYASETTFKVFNPDGTILFQGGPWPDLPTNGTTVREFPFIPIMNGCHRLEVYDAYGDGINAGYGAGNVKILNKAGVQIYYNNGQFGSKLTASVYVGPTKTITASAGTNGTISPVGETVYPEGANAKYAFIPNPSYEVEEVYINGEAMGMEKATHYIFTDLDDNYTINVTFQLRTTFFITATAGENGTISPEGVTEYPVGESATYTFTPDPGYEVEAVYLDGVIQQTPEPDVTSFTFTNIQGDHAIHVTFKEVEEIYYTITASAGENGTISPEGETEYLEGESATYLFIPDENYEVEEVFIDGEPMGLEQATEYTFPAVDKDYTIHVTFRLLESIRDVNGVTISVNPNPINDKLFINGIYEKLEIISISGQIVSTAYNQPVVDVHSLAKGFYFIKIQTNGQTCTFKVVK
ncbi:MAG: Omp28-related outer membrane protein [Bacteroidales bacterium]|jgi:hypothetical protein|nr:Omp28-related outer membrane protein [Bacteroidales bacterium]